MSDRPVILRSRIVTEPVEVPEGHLICSKCKGHGLISKYDQGVKSMAYDPELDAKSPCQICKGQGYVPRN
jgi:RecJ-like exonuclease